MPSPQPVLDSLLGPGPVRKSIPTVCLLGLLSLAGASASAQFPSTGLNGNSSFLSTDIDSVDLSSGNVNVHIPLLAFPQKGEKLRLAFNIRYNQPLWSVFTDVLSPTTSSVRGHWILNNTQYYAYNPSSTLLSPLGVDIVRDQGLTVYQTFQQYPCTMGDETVDCDGRTTDQADHTYTTTTSTYIRDRTGASHIVGVDFSNPLNVGGVHIAAPDGSGWTQNLAGQSYSHATFDIGTSILDRNGLVYSSTVANASTGGHRTWNIADADGNSITSSGNGWVDSVGRIIPGSWGDLGEDDPYPGVATNDLSHCEAGTVTSRVWNVPGKQQPYYFCFRSFTGTTHFNVTNIGTYTAQIAEGSYSKSLLTQLVLPNGFSYKFTYDPAYFELKRIDLPTGGYLAYTWGTIQAAPAISMPVKRAIITREVNDGNTSAFWSYSWDDGTYDAYRGMIVSKPDGNDEWHRHLGLPNSLFDEVAKYYSGRATISADTSQPPQGTVIQTVETGHTSFGSPFFTADPVTGPSVMEFSGPVERIRTTLADGSVKETDYTLVPNGGPVEFEDPSRNLSWQNPPSRTCFCLNYSQIQEAKEYDFGAGAAGGILRDTSTAYAFQQASSPYLAANMLDLPSSVQVSDGNGVVSSTTFSYDESTYSSGSLQGSLTTISRSVDGTNSISTHTSYNSSGVVDSRIDANGNHADVLSYQCSGSLPGEVAQAKGSSVEQHVIYQYDCNTGSVTSVKDANQKTTSYTYNDSLARLTAISYPDGGSTAVTYSDGLNSSMTVDTATGGTQGDLVQTTSFDGLGRTIASSVTGGGSVYTRYDPLGRTAATSNPTTASSQAAPYWTSFAYDGLGRIHLQCNSDNGTWPSACTTGTSYQQWDYTGPTATHSDEAGNSWQRTSDALGRLTTVVEPTGAATTYNYDGNSNLKSVNQAGLGGETPRLTRSFGYDRLSRLYKSFNLETGWICYGVPANRAAATGGNCPLGTGYDASGNLLTKTNARGMGTVYTYDALNRLKTKAYFGPGYQDGAVKTYYYDGSRADGGSAGTGLNQIGRLSSARSWAPFGNGLHDEYQSYDVMGRVTGRTEVAQSESGTGGHSIGMAYDLAGNLTSLTYPDGRVVTQSYDSAGRLNSVTDGNGQKYVSSVSYFPNGTPQTMVFSNDNMSEYTSLNSRLQVCETKIGNGGGPGTLFDRQYFYGSDTTSGNQCNDVTTNNGNLMHVLDSMNSTNSQHYTYDSLNRLTHWNGFSPAGTVRQQSFGYDSFGNMSPASSATAPSVTGLFDANNRLVAQTTSDCLSYDAAGNLTCTGTQNTDAHTYGFNEENELVLAWVAQNSTSNLVGQYSFDSSGTRVRSDNPTAHTWREYTYFNGQVLAEKDNTGNWTDHVYANGKRLARVEQVRPLLHVHGVRTQAGVNQGCGQNFYLDVGSFGNYTARSGDRIVFQQRSILARGGLAIQFSNGIAIAWDVPDQVGNPINYDTPDGNWHTRVVALPQSVNGTSIQAITATTEHQTGVGTYDTWIGDVAIVSADGAVTPLYRGQAIGATSWYNCDSQLSVATEATPVDGFAGTTYYTGDQVGTTQMEFAVDAWPIQRSEFAPFGQELSSQDFTRNRFKFTGKERDTESGLDYFGARYYGSALGRWMSPDWSSNPISIPFARIDNPQTLNLYGYVGNNPLRYRDSFGHAVDCDHEGDKSVICLLTTVIDRVRNWFNSRPDSRSSGSALLAAAPEPHYSVTSHIVENTAYLKPDYYSLSTGVGVTYSMTYTPKTNNLFFNGAATSGFKGPGAGVSVVAGWSLSNRPEAYRGANTERYLGGRGASGCFFDVVGGCVGYSPGGGGWALEAGFGFGGGSFGLGYAVDWDSYVEDVHNSLFVENGTTVNVQGLAVPDPQDPTNW